ncbi:hypothetical protein BRD00_07195 [Halobacteriales archaeon QS_8_69_26]|nr:MAG: hypothetical protein BRD00_07195 [Halobacteriales archaeon QS_8_69_26]
MKSNLFESGPDGIVRTVLAEAQGPTYVVAPDESLVEAVVETTMEFEDEPPEVRMLADGTILRRVMEDFIVASSAADLVADGTLEMRTQDGLSENPTVVTGDVVMAVVSAGGDVAGLTTVDDDFVGTAVDSYDEAWTAAEEFDLRTPPLSSVRETLASDVGADTEEDFSDVLSSLETARSGGDGLDEVTISLLVGAKNEQLFYDISRWGEDVGVASKATFSRTKNELEESGIIDTEKVPVDVGRPRQRLTIEDERLEEADSCQIASIAESILN